jgi:DNA polymerase III alpha subunit (gram-positive type)
MFTVEEETNVTPSIEKVKKAKEIKKITSEVVTGTADSLNSKLFRLEDHILILFDLETTGLNFSSGHRIIQIAAKVMLEDKEMFNAYVLPSGSIVSNEIAKLTGITQHFLNMNGMPIEDALRKFNDWIQYLQETKYPNKKIVLGGHNAKLFDFPFLKSEMQNLPTSKHITLSGITCFDSLSVLRDKRIWDIYGKKPDNFKLVTIYKHLMNSDFNAHDARSDVIALENCLVKVNFQSVVQDHLFIFS